MNILLQIIVHSGKHLLIENNRLSFYLLCPSFLLLFVCFFWCVTCILCSQIMGSFSRKSKDFVLSLMGNSRKYPYPTTDGFHVLTPPLAFGNYKMHYPPPPPMPSEFHNCEPPLPFRISRFFSEVHFRLSNAYMKKRT